MRDLGVLGLLLNMLLLYSTRFTNFSSENYLIESTVVLALLLDSDNEDFRGFIGAKLTINFFTFVKNPYIFYRKRQ
jgi:hypothetical protein